MIKKNKKTDKVMKEIKERIRLMEKKYPEIIQNDLCNFLSLYSVMNINRTNIRRNDERRIIA